MHLIGLALKRKTGLPWVADFRDPWSTMDYLDDFGLGPRARRLIAKMERAVVTAADRILVTSPGALREIGLDDTSKGAVIPNGWDKDDFPVDPPAPASNDKPVLGHFWRIVRGEERPGALGRPRLGPNGCCGPADNSQTTCAQAWTNLAWTSTGKATCPTPKQSRPCTHATRWWSSTTTATRPRPPPLERCSSVWPLGFPCSSSDRRMATSSPVRHMGGDVCAPRRARWTTSNREMAPRPVPCTPQIFPCVV